MIRVPVVNYVKVRQSQTIPDQSMSIEEIVKRFVRGIPVDVIQRQGIYVDQSEHDLESMSRMDFAEKAEMAAELAERAQAIRTEHEESERLKKESERKAKDAAAQASPQAGAGIGSLDNTMPVDTKQNNK